MLEMVPFRERARRSAHRAGGAELSQGFVYLATMTLADGQVTLLHPVGGGIMGLQPQYDA
jgi:hypothetical protein